MVTLSSFLQFWGVVFLATTGFVCFFKPEVENGVDDKTLGLVDTYKQVQRSCSVLRSRCRSCYFLLTPPHHFAILESPCALSWSVLGHHFKRVVRVLQCVHVAAFEHDTVLGTVSWINAPADESPETDGLTMLCAAHRRLLSMSSCTSVFDCRRCSPSLRCSSRVGWVRTL